MLQKLDTEHLNRLALAEALASMEPRDFDMRRPDRCICGHALRLFGIRTPYFGGWESQLGAGANLLGLSTDQARELFAPVNRAKQLRSLHPSAGCGASGTISRGDRYRRLECRWQALAALHHLHSMRGRDAAET